MYAMDEEPLGQDDPYKVLQVERTATMKEIEKAYKEKAKEVHPDKKGGCGAEFKMVKWAKDVLMDEQERRR